MINRFLPILVMLAGLLVLWYLAVAPMNLRGGLDYAERQGAAVTPATAAARRDANLLILLVQNRQFIAHAYALERPALPTPNQVLGEFWKTTGAMVMRGRAWSKRSLIYHSWLTMKTTLFGFALGGVIGMFGAIAMVYSRVAAMSLMPWAIISQTIPIVALAPMIIVLAGQLGIDSREVPKAIISAYLCFFPVLVGMIKGLRAPEDSQLDLLKTYNATGLASFLKLRLPASAPFLFTSLKIGIAAALVGTIVGELPTGAISGLGARLLIGDQFGTPLAIWSALLAAAILAGALVTLLDVLQKIVLNRMGMYR